MSHRCPACKRRVPNAPYVSLQDRHPRKITRYHGNVAGCLKDAMVEAQRRGPDEIVLAFYHTRRCGDPAAAVIQQVSCRASAAVLRSMN